MGIEENKKTLQRYFDELFNNQDYSKADEILHEEYTGAALGESKGIESHKRYVSFVRSVTSDAQFKILEMIAEGDKVSVFCEFGGTFDGEWNGITGIGLPFTRTIASVYEFKDEKVFRGLVRNVTNELVVYQQLGLIPSTDRIFQQYKEAKNLK